MRSKSSKPREAAKPKLIEIGQPQNFSHVVHVAPRPLLSVNFNDPHIQAFLKQAGVTEDHLSKLEVYETIVNFIQVHGVDEVKKEVDVAAEEVEVAAAPVLHTEEVQEELAPLTKELAGQSAEPKMEVREKVKTRDASPSLIARWFRGKKKPVAKEEAEVVIAGSSKDKDALKKAARIEVEPAEAVEKVLDDEEKLLDSDESGEKNQVSLRREVELPQLSLRPEVAGITSAEESDSSSDEDDKVDGAEGSKLLEAEVRAGEKGKKPKKAFSFKKKEEAEVAKNEEVKEVKGSFFSRWGRQSKSEESKKQKVPEEIVEKAEEKPKKTAGIFKRNLKKRSVRVSSSSDDDEERVNLKPDGDQQEEIIVAAESPAKPVAAKKSRFFKGKAKKAASMDQLQVEKGADAELDGRGSSSDDEGASKSKEPALKQKRDFFKFKGKKAVSVDVHQETQQEASQGKPSGLFTFKSKRESTESSYDKLEDQFDEAFVREAERASKLKIIPSTKNPDDSASKKRHSAGAVVESKKSKSATLDGHAAAGGGGFFRLGSRKKTSVSMNDVILPDAPRSSLPEEGKHKVRKYNVKKISALSSANSGDITSSADETDGKVVKRRQRKPKKTKADRQSGHSSGEDSPKKEQSESVFMRIFSRRSMSESRNSKKDKQRNKRRSSLDSVPKLKPDDISGPVLQQEQMLGPGTSDHIYENFPVKQAEDQQQDQEVSRSTDEEADEYYAQYHKEKKELYHTRRSWTFVMAELKERINSVDEGTDAESPVYQLRMVQGDEEEDQELDFTQRQVVRLQEMQSDPNLADHRTSSSEEEDDELQQIKKSVEQLDQDYYALRVPDIISEQPKSILEEMIVPEKVSEKLALPQRIKSARTSSSESEDENKTVQEVSRPDRAPTPPEPDTLPPPELDSLPPPIKFESHPIRLGSNRDSVQTSPEPDSIRSPSDQTPGSPSDSLEDDSLEPVTQTESVRSPASVSQDSLDSNHEDTNNNKDLLVVRQVSSSSCTESRPLSDCQLKIADSINLEELPVVRQVLSKPSRRLERNVRVTKRPSSSFSSSNDDSLPTSPVHKSGGGLTFETCSEENKEKTSSESSKGDSIPSSTEDLTVEEKNKENVEVRRSSENDDVFIQEEEEDDSSPNMNKRTSVERNASYHRAVEISSSLPLPRKNVQAGRRSSSNASRIPRPILKKPRRRTVDEWPTHRVTEL